MNSCRGTVLIIEDDEDFRPLLGEILQDEGYGVFMASDGQLALAQLRRCIQPDLILLDLNMPGMDGWQFRSEQLQDPSLSSIPVVVVSAGEVAARAAATMNAAGFLSKPISLDSIVALLGRLPAKEPRPLELTIAISSLI